MSPAPALTGRPGPSPRACPAGPDTVKTTLTPNRTRRLVENDEFAAFARRVLRAYSRRIALGDIEALTLMVILADDLDEATRQAINGLRAFGYSWAEIGSRLRITRQAAQQRWGHPS